MHLSVAQGRPLDPATDGPATDAPPSTAARAAAVIAPIAVGIVAFALIWPTILPGLDFWDTGELQTVGPLLGTAHPTGFPTYVILAWIANALLAPLGEPAFRMNVLSAIYIAIAAAVTVDLVRVLTRSLALGVAAGLGVALTDLVWALGTRAEAHALHLVFVAVLLRLLVGWEDAAPGRTRDRWLVAAAVVFGLSLGNHSLMLLLALPIGLYVLAVEPGILRRPRFVAACVVALLGAAALVFLQLPLRAGPFRAPLVYGRPETWDGFWYVVLAEQFRGSLIAPFSDLAAKTAALVHRTADSFGPLAILVPAGLVGAVFVRPRYALLTGTAVGLTCFFAASYDNADISRYYAGPVLIAWTWLALLAATLLRIATPSAVPRWARSAMAAGLAILLIAPTIVTLGSRAAAADRSDDRRARVWVDRAMAEMAPDAVVVSWWSFSTPLWYAQHVEGQRPDVAIIDDRTRLDEDLGDIYDVIDANLPTRPVYVIRADPREVRELGLRYRLDPIDGFDARMLTRVLGPREPAATGDAGR